jgi:hypothetical protein
VLQKVVAKIKKVGPEAPAETKKVSKTSVTIRHFYFKGLGSWCLQKSLKVTVFLVIELALVNHLKIHL